MSRVGNWARKVRRRKGGVYLVRTRKHASVRRENGYVGETVNYRLRQRQHLGVGRYTEAGNVRSRTGDKPAHAKSWTDLEPRWYRVIPLPWWLCWKWVLRPLETLVMVLTWPRYNVAKNRWNPRRVPLYVQQRQRALRDAGHSWGYLANRTVGQVAMVVAGALMMSGGLVGYVVTR